MSQLSGKTLLFHTVLWHGKPGTISLTGYNSNDPNVIGDQLTSMAVLAEALGAADFGVVTLTYGPTVDAFIHSACMEMTRQCANRNIPFALCYDPWTVKNSPNKDAAMLAALKHPDTQTMLAYRSYIPGHPIFDFATGCDASTILASISGIKYWMNGVDYDWVRIPSVSNKTALPCTFVEFNDGTGLDRNKQVWNQSLPCRIVPSLAGGTYLGRNIGTGQYVQFCTFNDVSEGTDIEKFASILSVEI